MEDHNRSHDIANEDYKGPSGFITGMGYVGVIHLASTALGALAGGIFGYFNHEKVTRMESALVSLKAKNFENPNGLVRLPSKFIGGIPEAANWVVNHIPGLKSLGSKYLKDNATVTQRWSSVVFAAGVAAAAAWIASGIYGLIRGKDASHTGKQQFKDAQKEIKSLRDDKQDLEKINDELHQKIVKISTQTDTPPSEDTSKDGYSSAIETAAKDQPSTDLQDTRLHLGKLALEPQREAGVPA